VPVPTTIKTLINEQLPTDMRAFLHSAGECADSNGFRLFLVGGMVRDLLLGRPSRDPDLLVQGTDLTMNGASDLADLLASTLGGEVTSRSQFGTAKLNAKGFETDLITARQETYSLPGALPDVAPATIEEDMARRDFTLNTLAADLSPGSFGDLIDLQNGGEDLEQGSLRILHDRSFQDDPTRLLRAARYETRLGLHMAPDTEAAARRDAEYLRGISGDRIRHELERIFDEPQPELALGRAEDMVFFSYLLSTLEWGPELTRAAQSLRESGYETSPMLFLALLALPLMRDNPEALVTRLNAPASWAVVIRDTYALRVTLPSLSVENIQPSTVYAKLAGLVPEAILAWSALAPYRSVRGLLLSFQMKWRDVKTHLTGDDLMSLGIPQGPEIGVVLQELLNARLDDVIFTREEEESFVKNRISSSEHT